MNDWEVQVARNPDACREAKRKATLYRNEAAQWLQFVRWVGAAAAIASVILIIGALAGSDITRNAAAIGTAVSGTGFAFVIRQRNVAVKRYNETLKDIAKYCDEQEMRQLLIEA